MAEHTLPHADDARQMQAQRIYGYLGYFGSVDGRPAILTFTFTPGQTIITGFQDAANTVARNLPTFTVASLAEHPCGHSTLVYADVLQCGDVRLRLFTRPLDCPACGPVRANPVPIFHQGVAEEGKGGIGYPAGYALRRRPNGRG